MSTRMTKTWFDGEKIVTQEIPEEQIYTIGPLYIPPPQRPWVGLTDEELSEVYNNSNWDFKQSWDYERAIEDKLRSKNT